jgi:hypothetical protein
MNQTKNTLPIGLATSPIVPAGRSNLTNRALNINIITVAQSKTFNVNDGTSTSVMKKIVITKDSTKSQMIECLG